MSFRYTAAAAWVLVGCAGSAIKAEPSGGEVSVELKTASKSGPGWQNITPGASLDSGTEFSVRVQVSQPAFLYIGQRAAGAELALIYPSFAPPSAPVRAEPSQPAELPGAGQWFRLDDHAGEEALFVLLSEKPQAESAAKQLLGKLGATACATLRDPPPPEVKHRDRGGDGGVRGTLGRDGLAVLCFPFHHR